LAFTLRNKTTDAQIMLRIQELDSGDLVTIVLSGRMQKEDLQEIQSLLRKHDQQNVVLDLKGVKLIDLEAVGFLANFETDQAKIANCPPYIREWIRREQAGARGSKQSSTAIK
jgi:ABC-type transporter Mla MlaB component